MSKIIYCYSSKLMFIHLRRAFIASIFLVMLLLNSCVALASNNGFLQEYQRKSRMSSDSYTNSSNKAFAKAAQRKLNIKASNRKSFPYWRDSSRLKKQIQNVITRKANVESLKQALILNKIDKTSRKLQKFICICLWETHQKKKAYLLSKRYLQENESPTIHKYLLLYAIENHKPINALFHFSKAHLTNSESFVLYLKIIQLEIINGKYNFLILFILLLLLLLFVRKKCLKVLRHCDHSGSPSINASIQPFLGITSQSRKFCRSKLALDIAKELSTRFKKIVIIDADISDKREVRYFDYPEATHCVFSKISLPKDVTKCSASEIIVISFSYFKQKLSSADITELWKKLSEDIRGKADFVIAVLPHTSSLNEIGYDALHMLTYEFDDTNNTICYNDIERIFGLCGIE